MITTKRLARWLGATVVSAGALFALTRASAAPLPYFERGAARLRISWRAVPERIEVCRMLSAEELAQREEHMRQRMDCDGRFATYALRAESDGALLDESVVRGAGLRHDRPMYVLRDFAISSGVHRVRISFARREQHVADSVAAALVPATEHDTGIFAGRAGREAVERSRRTRAAVPAVLVLDTSLTFAPATVVLVTFDPDRRRLLVIHTNPTP